MQQKLVLAKRQNQNLQVLTDLQRQIVTSYANRALAVRRVCTNNGGKTPGIDGVTWPDPKSRAAAIEQLQYWTQNSNHYKAQPVRRVYIPKPGKTEVRPLGIPTLKDRAMQAVYLSCVDPLVEETSDTNSYGFRPYRGSRDAMAKLRNLLGKDYSPNWLLDADIRKCFDKINHAWLLKNVPMCDIGVLNSWLESGVQTLCSWEATPLGVPQGGVISPLLCNLALNGAETLIQKEASLRVPKRQRAKAYVVRYADDLIASAADEDLLICVRNVLEEFLEPRGLELHQEKTRHVNLENGTMVEFLGFEFGKRKLNPKLNMPSAKNKTRIRLVMKPSKSNIKGLKRKVNKSLTSNLPMLGLIRDLNPKLRGWANYFRVARHSPAVFRNLGHWIWHRMLRWAQRKHGQRNLTWIKQHYIAKSTWRTNHWSFKSSSGHVFLYDISTVGYMFIPTVPKGLNPYVGEERYVLEQRAEKIALTDKASLRKSLLRRDKGLCPVCETSVLEGSEAVELHHIVPLKHGGGWNLGNLVLLHIGCHKQISFDPDAERRLKVGFGLPTD